MYISRRSALLPTLGLILFPYSQLRSEPINNSDVKLVQNERLEISEKITDAKKIDTNKYSAYYKVEASNGRFFYIVQSKDSRLDNLFLNYFDKNDQIFPKSKNRTLPVAIISAKQAGLEGDFKVYEVEGGYKVKYDFSPLITIPGHTKVSSDFIFKVENGIRKLPEDLTNDLYNRGIKIILGKDVNDTYYYYFPSWKTNDTNKTTDSTRPWLEVNKTGCTDNRRISNYPSLYSQKKVLIPEEYFEYKTEKVLNHLAYGSSWIDGMVGHELGHSIDFFNSNDFNNDTDSNNYSSKRKTYNSNGSYFYKQTNYSDDPKFIYAFQIDKERIDPETRQKVGYLWCNTSGGQKEVFADVTAALLGCKDKEKTILNLRTFPLSAEYIRNNVLPDFNIKLSLEDIRKIYPYYLENTSPVFVSN